MAKSLRSRRSLLAFVLVLLVAIAGLTLSTSTVAASGGITSSPTSGVFTGTDDSGNFQAALEDAVQNAAAAAGCCDIRINYEVLETTGRYGGFLFENVIEVKIYAKW